MNRQSHKKTKVVVGMSGGVDSSVTALLLKNQGYQVIGMFMKNWDEKDESGTCQAALEFKDVVSVCETLDIPYYSIDFVQEYRDRVFANFLEEIRLGGTPNPDILCNREIKFNVFLDKALKLGADYLATGHYCQTGPGPSSFGEGPQLLKGLDPQKDQSYFLYTLKSSILQKVLFPIGGLKKGEVRELAKNFRLSTHSKKDSTGICFIGERNFPQFLGNYIKNSAGDFVTLAGKVVGKHLGVPFYTIGQRKGLGLGGPGDAWYVVGKNLAENLVYVERGARHPALYADILTATDITWIGNAPPNYPFICKAKIRYRQADQDCVVDVVKSGKNGVGWQLKVTFPVPQRAITPRQSIVFYQGDVCLGGAIIQSAGPTYFEMEKPLPQVVSG